jgi:hypothetical protein
MPQMCRELLVIQIRSIAPKYITSQLWRGGFRSSMTCHRLVEYSSSTWCDPHLFTMPGTARTCTSIPISRKRVAKKALIPPAVSGAFWPVMRHQTSRSTSMRFVIQTVGFYTCHRARVRFGRRCTERVRDVSTLLDMTKRGVEALVSSAYFNNSVLENKHRYNVVVSLTRKRASKSPPLCFRQQDRHAIARRIRRTRGNFSLQFGQR